MPRRTGSEDDLCQRTNSKQSLTRRLNYRLKIIFKFEHVAVIQRRNFTPCNWIHQWLDSGSHYYGFQILSSTVHSIRNVSHFIFPMLLFMDSEIYNPFAFSLPDSRFLASGFHSFGFQIPCNPLHLVSKPYRFQFSVFWFQFSGFWISTQILDGFWFMRFHS